MVEPGTSEGFDPRRMWMIVRRRWWLVLLCAAAVTGAAYAFSKATQKQYTASASLLLQQTDLAQVLLSQPVSQPTVDPTREAATNVAEVSSQQVINMTALALHIPETTVANEVSVSAAGQTDVVTISATDPSPQVAANLVNTYAQQAISFRRQSDRAQVLEVQQAVQAQLNAMSPAARRRANGRYLRRRSSELQYLADAQTGNTQILSTASPPQTPSIPKTKRNLILGLLFGLVLGIGAAVGAERFSRRVRISGELVDIHGLPVLVEVPSSRGLRGGPLLPQEESDREPFRMLLAKLRYSNPGGSLRSILVTSARAGEGKTTIAWNLAAAAAAGSSQRVLLIETDLRRPVLAERYDLRDAPGLEDILTQQSSMDAPVIQTIAVEGDGNGAGPHKTIDVLVAGSASRQAGGLIDSKLMTQVLTSVGKLYDLIVIDSTPLLMSDAIPLLNKVDGVLVVSRVGVTTRDDAAMLRDQLQTLHAPALGLVANGVRSGSGNYGYYGAGNRHYDRSSGRHHAPTIGPRTGGYTTTTGSIAPGSQAPGSLRQERRAALGRYISLPSAQPEDGHVPTAGPGLSSAMAGSSAVSTTGESPDLSPAGDLDARGAHTAESDAEVSGSGFDAGVDRTELDAEVPGSDFDAGVDRTESDAEVPGSDFDAGVDRTESDAEGPGSDGGSFRRLAGGPRRKKSR